MKYKLFTCDFDDTLLSDSLTVSDRNRAAIAEYTAAGGIFTLMTGRMLSGILNHARDLGLHGLVGAYQGGMLADIDSGEVLSQTDLPPEETVRQLRELETRGLHAHLYYGDVLYVKDYDDEARMYERILNVHCVVTGVPLYRYAEERGLSSHKLMAIADHEVVAPLLTELKAQYPHLEYVLSKPTFLEIMRADCTKGEGLKRVAAAYGIPVSETVGMGDSMNDVSMLREAGLGVAVANATPQLKDVADRVLCFSNNEDAAAHVIEYILRGDKTCFQNHRK